MDLDAIEARLTEQIQLCTKIAAYAYRRGEKEVALKFHKMKKVFATDCESLRSLRANARAPPPFRYRDITYTMEVINDHLEPHELEICIHKAWDLHGARGGTPGPIDIYVNWDFGLDGKKGYTPTITKQRDPGKCDVQPVEEGNARSTPMLTRKMTEFNYVNKLTIQRNRMLQRHLERKRATFEVMHYRGFLRGSVCIGRATLPLDGLLSKCTINEIISVSRHMLHCCRLFIG
jgi:hypothetical protein